MSSEKVKITLELPRTLYDSALQKAKEAGFQSLSEFFIFILEQLIEEGESPSDTVFSPEEEKIVKERLRSLGYIE